jgi:DNA-binding MarR family transcriptional regulator
MNTHDQILIPLKQMTRSIDMYSKKIEKESGLTAPQLIVLKAIARFQYLSGGEIAREVNLSPATVSSILTRLEKKQLISRERSEFDKRKVVISLTQAGYDILEQAPSLMSQGFIDKFSQLEVWEQNLILSSIQRLAEMMNATDIDVSQYLVEPVDSEHSGKVA